jgi:predicted TPR repeat methyltransferase
MTEREVEATSPPGLTSLPADFWDDAVLVLRVPAASPLFSRRSGRDAPRAALTRPSHRAIHPTAILMAEHPSPACREAVVDLYERHAPIYDRDRSRALQERAWLDRSLVHVRPGGTVLDLGCGMGEPIARYLIDRGFRVVGLDSSASMIALCRARFPDSEWLVADMCQLALGRRFDGILAWDSFFHLGMDDQRRMFRRFAAHAQRGAPLMFTSGPAEGETIGTWCEEPLYHASLGPADYERLLTTNGFEVRAHVPEDPACGMHTVWIATYDRGLTSR